MMRRAFLPPIMEVVDNVVVTWPQVGRSGSGARLW